MNYSCTKTSSTLVAAISLILMSSLSARAQQQQPRVLAPPERVLTPRLETRESLQQEFDRRTRAVDDHNTIRFDDFRARRQTIRMMTATQVKLDTERIQFFNAEMMRSVFTNASPDYEGIAKAAGEIKKRAARLMRYLNLPRMDKSERPQTGPEYLEARQLAASLKRLDDLVRRFGANSLAQPKSASVIDVRAAIDARQDLEEIIALSNKIKESAKRLSQAARP